MPVARTRKVRVESRLVPVNAILDLALADGLNPAPLADAGWAVAALEVPVRVNGETVVCDVVLFNRRPVTFWLSRRNRARTWNLSKAAG
jgi:hypothetical protein